MATDHTIILGTSGDPKTTVKKRDNVRWQNDTGNEVTISTFPKCLKKNGQSVPFSIAAQGNSQYFEVKHDASKKAYSYTWSVSGATAPRNGTIDVN